MSVISVVRNARNLKYPMSMPLTAPNAAPNTKVTGIAAIIGHFKTCIRKSAQKFVSANMDPTDKSIPPTIITRAMPKTMKPISPAWRLVSDSDAADKKLGITCANEKATSSRTTTGIAVSIQRLDKISPSA